MNLKLLYVSLVVLCAGTGYCEEKALSVEIAPSDKAIVYGGRFDLREADGPRCAWAGSAINAKFEGTAISARFKCSAAADYMQISIDGKSIGVLTLKNGETSYKVASGLTDGVHTLQLMKRTEPVVGTIQFLGFQLEQGKRLLPLPRSKRRIEIIGDSISCGYGNEADDRAKPFKAETENNYLAYGATAARELDAEYACIAWSGKWLIGGNSIVPLYDRILPGDASSKWDFAQWIPDVVLINLGTNDFGKEPPGEKAWVTAYVDFIKLVRGKYPKARIYCASGPMMSDSWPRGKMSLTVLKGYIAKVIESLGKEGDKNIAFLEFYQQTEADGYGADWHPSLKSHRKMADKLIDVLGADLGWKK